MKHLAQTRVWERVRHMNYLIRTLLGGDRDVLVLLCWSQVGKWEEDIKQVNGKGYNPIGNYASNKDPVALQSLFLIPSLWSKLDPQVQIRATSMTMILKSWRTDTQKEDNLASTAQDSQKHHGQVTVSSSQRVHIWYGAQVGISTATFH